MAALFEFSQSELTRFLLILARVSPLMMTAPIWGSPMVPAQVRTFIAVLVSGLLLPAVRGPLPAGLSGDVMPLTMAVAWELLVGFLIAYLAQLMFAAAQLAGQMIDIQMGFGMANVIDPMTSAQVTLIGQLQYLSALLVFLLLDGHHLLLRGLAETFAVAPLGRPLLSADPLKLVVAQGGAMMFNLAFRIAAPALTALFLANLAMGMVSRMLPQINIFLVGMPVNVGVGLIALAASLTVFTAVWRGAIGDLTAQLAALKASLGGPGG